MLIFLSGIFIMIAFSCIGFIDAIVKMVLFFLEMQDGHENAALAIIIKSINRMTEKTARIIMMADLGGESC